MTLFRDSRSLADQLMTAMRQWTDARRKDAQGFLPRTSRHSRNGWTSAPGSRHRPRRSEKTRRPIGNKPARRANIQRFLVIVMACAAVNAAQATDTSSAAAYECVCHRVFRGRWCERQSHVLGEAGIGTPSIPRHAPVLDGPVRLCELSSA